MKKAYSSYNVSSGRLNLTHSLTPGS